MEGRVMNIPESIRRQERLRIVLSEYGKPVESPAIGQVTVSDDGFVSWEQLGFDKSPLIDNDYELIENLWNDKTKIKIVEITETVNRKRQNGLHIRANSHVGHVAFDTFDLVILPKFDNLAEVSTEKNPSLATLLAYAFNLNDLKVVGEQLSPTAHFAEILIRWLLNEIHSIQRRGVFQQYRRERRDLPIIRGKIDIKTWMRRGCIPSERMPCVFSRRSVDNILNQTLCAGLRRCVAIAGSDSLKNECRRLADNFALFVSDRTLDYRMLAEARRGLNRLNAHYENAVRIIKLLYTGSGGFVLGDTLKTQTRIPGFFFDMNHLFEMVVWRFLHNNLPRPEYKVICQKEYEVFFDEQRKLPVIKPDIIISKGEEQFVFDTKYKDIEDKDGEVASADLYQLSIYALTCSRHLEASKHRAGIIYPAENGVKRWKIILRQSQLVGEDDLCTITLHPIVLEKLAEAIDKKEGERKDFALGIIGL